ncbi:MAG: hypothetical protein Q8M92_05195 [Candidatus Subteraquimicrobiales bacterium]|nr:hypothetical protein [Candidatus Subteraquimicrobiales bacterium]
MNPINIYDDKFVMFMLEEGVEQLTKEEVYKGFDDSVRTLLAMLPEHNPDYGKSLEELMSSEPLKYEKAFAADCKFSGIHEMAGLYFKMGGKFHNLDDAWKRYQPVLRARRIRLEQGRPPTQKQVKAMLKERKNAKTRT